MLIFDQLNKADRHLRLISWIIAGGLVVLLGGLWWVQVVSSRQFVESQFNQSYRTVRVPAPRGKIMDRNGMVLAENKPVYSVTLYLEDRTLREAVQKKWSQAKESARRAGATRRKPNFFERVLSLFGYKPSLVQPRRLSRADTDELLRAARYIVVSNIVSQLSAITGNPIPLNEVQLWKHYKQKLILPFPIVPKLNEYEIARVQERGLNLPGIDMEVQPERVYPHRTLAAHTLGSLIRHDDSVEGDLAFFDYKLPDYRGYSGIEASFDSVLRGRAGAKSVLINNVGYRQTDTILSPVEAGKDLTLTIDAEIQRTAEKALNEIRDIGQVRGAAVVLDVRSGEIISLASVPGFDPQDWIPFLPNTIAGLYTNEYLAPLRNRAIYGNYAPGSTFKIFVALAGLEAGTLDTNELVHVEPHPREPGRGIYYVGSGRNRHAFRDSVHGDFKFRQAFIKSSNGYFIEHGLRATPQRIVAMAQQFHFGDRTGIPLPDSPGMLPTTDYMRRYQGGWSSAAIGNLSIGQGALDVTPLQLAVAVAAVANNGKVLKPQLVLNVRGPDELISPNQPTSLPPIVRDELRVSQRSLEIVRQAMLADVEDPVGTGSGARVAGFRVCAKTGTAQVERGTKIDHYTWFASYGPFEDPRYAVVVMVESGISGGGTCAPVAQQIYEKLKYREQKLPRASGNSVVKN